MAKPPPTSDGTPRLSELARHVVVPSGIVSTGWPAVRDKCADLGIGFDPWQDGTGRLILAKREDGLYATTIGGVVISIPRQVGKTFLLGAIVFALCLLFPNLTVIWTAHRLRTAAETFSAMQGMTRRAKIKPFVAKVVLGSGEEEIQFHNGSRIMFGARERGFGRGFSGVDVLVFDEAQILTENAIDDMVPATNQAPNPLILFTGTPPKPTDPGEVFKRKRAEALAGKSDDTVYVEFSADDGAAPQDRAQWRKANPSHPHRTPVAAMLRMLKNLSEESFAREGMGIWDAPTSAGLIDLMLWLSLLDLKSETKALAGFGFDVAPGSTSASIMVVGERADGLAHLELIQNDPGTSWCLARLVSLWEKWQTPIVLDPSSPAGAFVEPLEAAGVKVVKVSTHEYAHACQAFVAKVAALQIHYRGGLAMDRAIEAAKKRDIGDGGWGWARKKTTADISPLVAATLALHGMNSVVTPAPEPFLIVT